MDGVVYVWGGVGGGGLGMLSATASLILLSDSDVVSDELMGMVLWAFA